MIWQCMQKFFKKVIQVTSKHHSYKLEENFTPKFFQNLMGIKPDYTT